MLKSRQNPCPATPYSPYSLEVSKDITHDLRVVSLNEALSLVRYFLTKLLDRGEELSPKEQLAFVLLSDKLRTVKDREFLKKNMQVVKICLYLSKISTPYLSSPRPVWILETVKLLKGSQVFLSPRAYLGRVVKLGNILKRNNRRLRRDPPPLAYIGVGYRDKGTTRLHHLDGNPSWQDVVAGQPDNVRNNDTMEKYLVHTIGSTTWVHYIE